MDRIAEASYSASLVPLLVKSKLLHFNALKVASHVSTEELHP